MRGIPLLFVLTASIYALIGMAWGIQMSATEDHMLSPAHSHLNLIGWVSMAIFGLYYHVVPAAAKTLLAKIHFIVATLGTLVLTPGIVLALEGDTPVMAKIGSAVVITSGLIFTYTVARTRSE